jgi:hypothetical protein
MRGLPQWLLICVLWPAGFLFPCIMSCGRESLAVITEGGRLGNKHEGSLWGTGPGFHRLRGGSESGGAIFFSGGTAFNSLAGPLSRCFDRTVHVLPISDDGGSSAEIRRVFGAPALGDIRARLVKLAQVSSTTKSKNGMIRKSRESIVFDDAAAVPGCRSADKNVSQILEPNP